MAWLQIDGLNVAIARLFEVQPIMPLSHHGGFHMDQWPWWPGPMHIAYPILFVGVVFALGFLAFRKR